MTCSTSTLDHHPAWTLNLIPKLTPLFTSPAKQSTQMPLVVENNRYPPHPPPQTHNVASPPALQSNIGRMYPGMHQQQAFAKAQAQQRQQQQIIQQQQQQRQQAKQKGVQPSDPMVEQKITQLLNSMRAKPNGMESSDSPMLNLPRPRKDEEDMDEDERLLNSEEGKKLSSKERRQLRNKVSARAFRSRRKGQSHIPDNNSFDLSLIYAQNTSPNSRLKLPPRSQKMATCARKTVLF
jgi:bZIP-type transcription factor MBZ1